METGGHSNSSSRSSKLEILIPEGVSFSYPLAGPVSRFLAWLVDSASIFAAASILENLVAILGVVSLDLSQAVSMIVFFVILVGYAMTLEWFWSGQTIGKRLMGLRVMDMRGLRLQPGQVVIRNLLRAVDSLPIFYLLGGLVCLFSRYGQRLGDLAGNTVVVRNRAVPPPKIDQILAAHPYNSLRNYPHLAARLRQQVSAREADIALQAVARREILDPRARVELFRAVAGHFRRKVRFPDEALDGISDEQYVRNVVDLLFRRQPGSAKKGKM